MIPRGTREREGESMVLGGRREEEGDRGREKALLQGGRKRERETGELGELHVKGYEAHKLNL